MQDRQSKQTGQNFWQGRKGTAALFALLVLFAALSFRFGSAELSFADFCRGIAGAPGYETQSAILCLSFWPKALYALPFAAFFGAFGATMLILAMAGRIGSTRATVVLAGIALTALLNAGISFLSMMDSEILLAYHDFSAGGLAGIRLQSLAVPGAIILASLAVSLLASRRIQLLCLGDTMALSLGVRVKALRMVCLVCASAAASAVVSFAGLLGFVGLVVPHIARRIVGEKTKSLLLSPDKDTLM